MRRVTAIGSSWWQTVAVAAGVAFLVAACGSSGTSTSGSSPATTPAAPSSAAPSAAPGPTSALCQDAAALRASIHTLTHVNVGQGMGDEIKSDLADVRAKRICPGTSCLSR